MEGNTNYPFFLKQTREYNKTALLNACIDMVKMFENKGFKISIDDFGNGYWLDFCIVTSWSGKVEKCKSFTKRRNHLYDTDNGIWEEEE